MKRGEMSSGKKLARKTVEKHRRVLMKSLCFKMASLIPRHHLPQPREFLSQQDQLEYSVAYIEILRAGIEELRRRKTQLMNMERMIDYGTNNESRHPILTVKELGSGVEVILVSGLRKAFRLRDVITIIEQEAADVVTVGVSKLGDKTIHTIHAQVKISRVGVDAARICGRIRELISST